MRDLKLKKSNIQFIEEYEQAIKKIKEIKIKIQYEKKNNIRSIGLDTQLVIEEKNIESFGDNQVCFFCDTVRNCETDAYSMEWLTCCIHYTHPEIPKKYAGYFDRIFCRKCSANSKYKKEMKKMEEDGCNIVIMD